MVIALLGAPRTAQTSPVEHLGTDALGLAISPGPPSRLFVASGSRLLSRPLNTRQMSSWRTLGTLPTVRNAPGQAGPQIPQSPALETSSQGSGPANEGRQGWRAAAVPLVATRAGVILGGADGIEHWTLKEGGLHRQHHPLDGLDGTVLAADQLGRKAFVAQGRWLWQWTTRGLSRISQGPGGPWRHLATHPRLASWLLGGDGRRVYWSLSGGQRWERLQADLGELGVIQGARFAACPSPSASLSDPSAPGGTRSQTRRRALPLGSHSRGDRAKERWDLLLLGTGGLWWVRDGEVLGRLRTNVPVRALVEAHPEDPAIYVVADRLYRWPCAMGSHQKNVSHAESAASTTRPEVMDVSAWEVVAMSRDPARPGRLWLLGSAGLRYFHVAPIAPKPEARIEPHLPDAPERLPFRLLGQVTPSPRMPRASSAGGLRSRRANYLPVVVLSGVVFAGLGNASREVAMTQLRSHQRRRFGLHLSLRWPLGNTPALQVEEEALVAQQRRAEKERLQRHRQEGAPWAEHTTGIPQTGIHGGHGGIHAELALWAAAQERAALDRYFHSEDSDPQPSVPRQKEKP